MYKNTTKFNGNLNSPNVFLTTSLAVKYMYTQKTLKDLIRVVEILSKIVLLDILRKQL